MPSKAVGWGAMSAKAPLQPIDFVRRDPKDNDVAIKIAYCGVCHSDLHTVRAEWPGTYFPMVPGHEIVGHVTAVGNAVTKFKVGDTVGVGCMVDSCLKCSACKAGEENYCEEGMTGTYGSMMRDGSDVTFGGYSDHMVVREEFVLRIPSNLDLAAAAPLLCAGITTYSPLRHWKVTRGSRVGVVGLGGLGHMAVKLAHAMGAEVTVFTTSESKTSEAKKLGANHVVLSRDAKSMEAVMSTFDVIIDTVAAKHDLTPYILTLRLNGTHVLVGGPEHPHPEMHPFPLIMKRRSLAGSVIGGIRETQEMLDFCGQHNITANIELIKIDKINEAYERMLKSDVRYRFVIDIASLHANK